MNNLRVIIAGGGTGGHIFPAIAVGKALQRLQPGTQLLFVGALGKMEMEKVPQAGFEIVGLDIAGFNRSNILKNLSLPYKLIKSRFQARRIMREFKPNAVVGVGGYASFPMLQAAQGMGIPTLIQEQNSFAGKSNRILGTRAKSICVAYSNMDKFFPAEKIIVTGNPVRKEITAVNVTTEEAKEGYGLDSTLKTVLVIGGSLGAKSINEAIGAGLDELLKENVQLIWQTGTPYFEQAKQQAAKYGGRVVVVSFIKEMGHAYAAADVVVSRAGALAIAELCIAGKPVLFVPYPFAADDHQKANAMALVNNNGAVMIQDSEAGAQLIKRLLALLADKETQLSMSQNLQAMAIKDADERIAHKVIAIANKS